MPMIGRNVVGTTVRFRGRKNNPEQIRDGKEVEEETKMSTRGSKFVPCKSRWVPGGRNRIPNFTGQDERVPIYMEVEQGDEVAVEPQILGAGRVHGP